MENETLYLWFGRPDDFEDKEILERASALLSEDERSRLRSFKFEASRREYLAAHLLARTGLSHCSPHAPESWRFRANPYGKPFVDPPCDLSFSLSRRRGLVACLVARGYELGVDVESIERSAEIIEIAKRVFSAQELAQLDQMSPDLRLDHAASLWTLKEARCKARGMGFTLPLQKFSFVRSPSADLHFEVDFSLGDDTARWKFCLLDRAGHRVTLMVERWQEPRLEVREMRPFQVPSLPPEKRRPSWFPRAKEST
jgi:4'-phosphopantetheinyl transferase